MFPNAPKFVLAGLTAIVAALLVGQTATADAPSGYTVTEIDPPAMDSGSVPSGFNASGQVIVQHPPGWGYGTAARLSEGTVTDLHPGEPFTISQVYDINSAGNVAIVASIPPADGNGPYSAHIFQYSDDVGLVDLNIQSMGGAFAQQGAQQGPYADAVKLNNAGDLAGDWKAGTTDRVFLHTQEGGWTDLGALLPDNPSGEARFIDLNEQRKVLFKKESPSLVFVYSIKSKTLEQIGGLEALDDARDMNNAGQVTGLASFNGEESAYRYTPGEGIRNLDPNQEFDHSFGIMIADNGNVAGRIIGISDFFHWTEEGGMQPLNIQSLHPEAAPAQVTAFNSNGEIAGTLVVPPYEIQSFYWSPETGPMLAADLIDPSGDVYNNASILEIRESGQMLISASRVSDGETVPVILSPDTDVVGDLNADGAVGVSDLLMLLSAWGDCNDCAADLDDNGSVDASDLLMLLSNWG